MNTNTILVGIIGLLIGGIVGYAVDARNDGYRHRYQTQFENQFGYNRMPMMFDGNDGDFRGMHGMFGMMVTSEKAFLEEMIPHHQEAVDTAKEVIARGGTTPEIMTLAQNIVSTQEKEIADMKQWYQSWYGTPYQDTGTYQPMMRELETLSGSELDKAFLNDMIMHHMGAIMMARSVFPFIEHNEMEALTEAIIKTQSEEIEQMLMFLQKL
ncbi:MAG: DUF305 domain-containing protein [Patescibacteria group bacterium]